MFLVLHPVSVIHNISEPKSYYETKSTLDLTSLSQKGIRIDQFDQKMYKMRVT